MGPRYSCVGLLMTDVEPPSYDARRATAGLVLFMTHVASCGAGAVIKNSQEPGQSYIDCTDPEFRQKLATRLGMARHRADVEAIQATRFGCCFCTRSAVSTLTSCTKVLWGVPGTPTTNGTVQLARRRCTLP